MKDSVALATLSFMYERNKFLDLEVEALERHVFCSA